MNRIQLQMRPTSRPWLMRLMYIRPPLLVNIGPSSAYTSAIRPTATAAIAQEPMLKGPASLAACIGPNSQPEPIMVLTPTNSRPMTPASLRNLPWATVGSLGGAGGGRQEANQARPYNSRPFPRHRPP